MRRFRVKRHEKLAGDILVAKAIDKLKLDQRELERRVAVLEKEAKLIKISRDAHG